MAAKRNEQRLARLLQDKTGLPYQKCLVWVRDHQPQLRERTAPLIAEHGLATAMKMAAVALAEEIGI